MAVGQDHELYKRISTTDTPRCSDREVKSAKNTSIGLYGRGRSRNFQMCNSAEMQNVQNAGLVTSQNVSGVDANDSEIGKEEWSSRSGADDKTATAETPGAQFDEISEWEEETVVASSEQYVVKPKTYIPKQFKAETVSFHTIRDANPDVSPKWLANTLAQKPMQDTVNEMQQVITHVERMWTDDSKKDRSNRDVTRYLSSMYSKSVNPFALVVYLIDKAKDTHTAKTTTLSFLILKEFDKWCKINHSRLSVDTLISKDIQMQIYAICTRNHLTMFEMAVKCFRLCYPGNDHFLPKIRNFIKEKKFKEAAVCTGRLGLQHHFDMSEIILPLILQDKINLLEVYVFGFPQQQEIMVQYLDHLCDRATDLELVQNSIPKVAGVKREKFQKKPLSKLAVRLMKLYRIPQGKLLYTYKLDT